MKVTIKEHKDINKMFKDLKAGELFTFLHPFSNKREGVMCLKLDEDEKYVIVENGSVFMCLSDVRYVHTYTGELVATRED